MSFGHLFAAGAAVAAALAHRPSRREALLDAESRRLEVVALTHRVGDLEAQLATATELVLLGEDARIQCDVLDHWPCADGTALADPSEPDLEAA